MGLNRRGVLKLISYSTAGLATGLRPWKAFADRCPVIHRDVCILGGSPVSKINTMRLRKYGKSVVVLERKERLGGHCETYRDPATGQSIDYGVVVFHDLPGVRDYFARFQ